MGPVRSHLDTFGRDAVFQWRLGVINFRAFQAIQAVYFDLVFQVSNTSLTRILEKMGVHRYALRALVDALWLEQDFWVTKMFGADSDDVAESVEDVLELVQVLQASLHLHIISDVVVDHVIGQLVRQHSVHETGKLGMQTLLAGGEFIGEGESRHEATLLQPIDGLRHDVANFRLFQVIRSRWVILKLPVEKTRISISDTTSMPDTC